MTTSLSVLSISLVVMGVVYIYVLSKYWKLLQLSKQFGKGNGKLEQQIVDLAAKDPKRITMVTQSILSISILLLVAKIF